MIKSWQSWQSGKKTFSTFYYSWTVYMICRYRNILGQLKTWYNSNIFGNSADFSSEIFWAQIVLMPRYQNELSLFANNIYIENIGTVRHRKLWRLDIVQNFHEFCQFFYYDFLGPKCFDTFMFVEIYVYMCIYIYIYIYIYI